jgi:predicted DNA-binding protein with PD1-like motif
MEDGDVLNDTLQAFAAEHGVERGLAFYVGGVADRSRIVVGPDETADTMVALVHELSGSQEAFCVGTIFPNEAGQPVLHMHTASGREGDATVGCTRAGVRTWLTGEVVLIELIGGAAQRKLDEATGFTLLNF